MTTASRLLRTTGTVCTVALGAAVLLAAASTAHAPTGPERRDFAPIVAAWPDSYTVTGTKSEPGYVEHITTSRDGDRFALEIVIEAQGTGAGGASLAEVAVDSAGTVRWTAGSDEGDCADDDAVRGFLATASVLSAQRQGRLPVTATIRRLGDHEVACVADGDLFPGTRTAASPALDPCFSVDTGAVLGHYSDVNASFVGPTMSPGSISSTIPPQ